jgi:hypothetical protein
MNEPVLLYLNRVGSETLNRADALSDLTGSDLSVRDTKPFALYSELKGALLGTRNSEVNSRFIK